MQNVHLSEPYGIARNLRELLTPTASTLDFITEIGEGWSLRVWLFQHYKLLKYATKIFERV